MSVKGVLGGCWTRTSSTPRKCILHRGSDSDRSGKGAHSSKKEGGDWVQGPAKQGTRLTHLHQRRRCRRPRPPPQHDPRIQGCLRWPRSQQGKPTFLPHPSPRTTTTTNYGYRVNTATPSIAPRAGSRLPTNILRSNSAASNVSANSQSSTAVIPPKTRPITPTEPADAAPPDRVSTPTIPPNTDDGNATPPEGIPAPIVDREEKKIRGYKNIPSLDAITERMRRAKLGDAASTAPSVSVTPETGKATTPETELSEQTPTNEAPPSSEGVEHPLQHTW